MSYYIGIDGGGTKSKCVLTDENLTILAESTGSASNFLVRGAEEVAATLNGLVVKCSDIYGILPEEIDGVLVGSTGAGRKADALKLRDAMIKFSPKAGFNYKYLFVESDARIALEGAFSGKPGAILIAGTGSILFGKDSDGFIHRVGGFGRIIGDEGSGFSIGKEALRYAAKFFDGRGEKFSFIEHLKDEYHITGTDTLIAEVYSNGLDIASLTPFIVTSAKQGDPICKKIIDLQSDELIEHVAAIDKILKQDSMDLSFIGGLITTDNYYYSIFADKLRVSLGNVIIKSPDYSPEIGAVLLAKQYLEFV